MIYFEFRLEGNVRVYEMTDRLLILLAAIETEAEALPVAQTIEEAHEYFRASCFQFEMFESLADAQDWVDTYTGFRAEEALAAFIRFRRRVVTFKRSHAA